MFPYAFARIWRKKAENRSGMIVAHSQAIAFVDRKPGRG